MKTYRIKPLKWKREKKDEYVANALKVKYSVFKGYDRNWCASYFSGHDFRRSSHENKDAAKQWCQDQYEKELKECLEEL